MTFCVFSCFVAFLHFRHFLVNLSEILVKCKFFGDLVGFPVFSAF